MVYLGFRPKDSYIMHDSFIKISNNSYNHNKNYKFAYFDILKDKYKTIIECLNLSLSDLNDKLNSRPFLGINP
jgi:hypothetical protein